MRLLIVRHAEPNYEIDSLTEKGWREADFLTERLTQMDIDYFYVSPLGRAQDTIKKTLKITGKTAKVCTWLQEFPGVIDKPNDKNNIVWDWLPEDWTNTYAYFDKDKWYTTECMKKGNIEQQVKKVYQEFDNLLEKHGYKRLGNMYQVIKANHDTICLSCHFGLESVLLSRLLNISPMTLWHGTSALPSSLTTLYTEERRQGKAYFRMTSYGDTSHLYHNSEEPSFMVRFCECFRDDTRHD